MKWIMIHTWMYTHGNIMYAFRDIMSICLDIDNVCPFSKTKLYFHVYTKYHRCLNIYNAGVYIHLYYGCAHMHTYTYIFIHMLIVGASSSYVLNLTIHHIGRYLHCHWIISKCFSNEFHNADETS